MRSNEVLSLGWYGRQEGHAKPNSNQSSRSSTAKQVSQLLLGLVGTLCFKIMIFSPFHKNVEGEAQFIKNVEGEAQKVLPVKQ